jgi:hypothetical protein
MRGMLGVVAKNGPPLARVHNGLPAARVGGRLRVRVRSSGILEVWLGRLRGRFLSGRPGVFCTLFDRRSLHHGALHEGRWS